MTAPATDPPHSRSRPLTAGQQGLLLQTAASGPVALNVPTAVHLTGALDVPALRRALDRIAERHDVLRTTFPAIEPTSLEPDRQPAQLVHPAGPVPLPVVDLEPVPADERTAAARRIVEAEAARPFNIAGEPGFKIMLLRLGAEEHVLFWLMSHLVCDGWSKSVFARELSALYTAYTTGASADVPKLAVDFGDYVAETRDRPRIATDLTYWREQLRGVADLPPLLAAEETGDPPGSAREIHIPSVGVSRDQLLVLAQRTGSTEFIVLHAAFAAAMCTVLGSQDLIVNTPRGDRPTADFENLIGFFVNVLPIRSRIDPTSTFTALIGQVREEVIDGLDHADAPIAEIAAQLASDHAGRVGPLTHISFAYDNLPAADLSLHTLKAEPWPIDRADTRYPFELHLWSSKQTIVGRATYRADQLTAATAHRLLAQFQAVLAAVLSEPDTPLNQLPSPALHDGRQPTGQQTPAELTPTEQRLVEVWTELLGTDDISAESHFFTIGGSSLLAALLVASIRETFAAQIHPRDLYRAPTLRTLAALIDDHTAPASPAPR
ncbi:condensation domain-containing protein [Streptomyces erythrochromogenes]|uniref:condensation domain-containing protein n=1 Tax=Streptomyces erythrochromogenes TaxID=285574 RepID=UPI00342EAB76